GKSHPIDAPFMPPLELVGFLTRGYLPQMNYFHGGGGTGPASSQHLPVRRKSHSPEGSALLLAAHLADFLARGHVPYRQTPLVVEQFAQGQHLAIGQNGHVHEAAADSLFGALTFRLAEQLASGRFPHAYR